MAPVSGNFYTLAIGKQSAKGSAQTTPTYKLKVTGGDISPSRQEFELAETDASRQQGSTVIVGAHVEGNPEFYVRPDDFGLLAYGLLGTNADGGTASNYVHVASMLNSGALPYFTIYKAVGSTVLVDRYVDVRLSGMKVKGQAGQPLSVELDVMGLTADFGQTDPVLAPVSQDPLVYPNVTVTKGGSAPGTVEAFELDITNNPLLIEADTGITPYDIVPGKLQVSGTMTVLFENDADYRAFHTGSTSGTTMTTTLYRQQLILNASVNANLGVQFLLNNVAYTAYPVAPDPSGAPIKVAIGFRSQRDATTLPNYVQITTRNGVASY